MVVIHTKKPSRNGAKRHREKIQTLCFQSSTLGFLRGQFALHEDISGLLTGGGVDVEVLEEDLRGTSARSTTLVVVGALDVDGGGYRGIRVCEGSSLAVGTGDTVTLRLGCLDDEFQVGDIGGDVGQGEGHRGAGDDHSGGCRSLNAGERGRSLHDVATAVDNPVVEPHKEVCARNLGFGAENGLALCGVGRGIPGENLGIGKTLPGLRELLENSFYGRLERGPGRTAVSTVADVLATARLSSGDTLCGARHFVEGS